MCVRPPLLSLVRTPGQGPVSRKSRPKLFGPEKPFVKLPPAYSVKLLFSYVVKRISCKISLLETPSFWRYKENYVARNSLEKFRDFQETAPDHFLLLPVERSNRNPNATQEPQNQFFASLTETKRLRKRCQSFFLSSHCTYHLTQHKNTTELSN